MSSIRVLNIFAKLKQGGGPLNTFRVNDVSTCHHDYICNASNASVDGPIRGKIHNYEVDRMSFFTLAKILKTACLVYGKQTDKERSLKILKEDGFFIERLSQELRSDKDIAIAAVSPKNGGGPAYRDLDDSIKNDPDVIAATKKGNLAEGYDENEGID